MLVWRPIMSGHVSLGEVLRGEIPLEHIITLNQLIDGQSAAEKEAMKHGDG